MTEGILIAIITGGFSLTAVLLQRSRKENKDDHGFVVRTLERVEEKLDNHIDRHASGDFD